MFKVCIVNRGSLSTDKFVLSRSIFSRVLEPLLFCTENLKSPFSIEGKMTSEITEEILKKYDVLVFCKHNLETDVQLAIKAKELGKKIVYDIDDLIYKFTSDSLAYAHMKNVKNLEEMLRFSDLIVTSNPELDKRIRSDFNLTNTIIVPTGFNTDKYFKAEYKDVSNDVIFTNGDNIKVTVFYNDFVNCFNTFLTKNPSITFKVFGDSDQYLKPFVRHLFLGSMPWDEHKDYLNQHQFKFGIVPLGGQEETLEHQNFSVCKTPIKFFEYGSARIPTIYSKSKIYTDCIEDGITGLLVENDDRSWTAGLEKLNSDSLLRKRIADNAFEQVASVHHIKFSAKAWEQALLSLTE